MSKTDPTLAYSPDSVRAFQPEDNDRSEKKRALNAMAKTVAAQYRDDSLSPAMISGIVRLLEFCVMSIAGFAVFFHYVGLAPATAPAYAMTILFGSVLTVVAFEFAEGYRVSRLRRRQVLCLLRPRRR